jgi:ribosomal protein S18 acetylase RimI-like enzyme
MDLDATIVRKAWPSDAEGIARVHITSSEDSYAPLARDWPAQDLSARTRNWAVSLRASLEDASRVDLVATVHGVVVGFISGGPARRSDLAIPVEVYVVHVLPEYRGRGVGSQLWELACTTLRGPARVALYVDTLAELPCCAFYEARGGDVLTRVAGTFHGAVVTQLVYIWPAGKPHRSTSLRSPGAARRTIRA